MATTFDNLELRVNNLENLVNGLIDTFNKNKFYTDADIEGCAVSISNITPTIITKTAYIGDTEVVFTDVVSGNLTVYVTDDNGNTPNYTVTKAEYIKITFNEPLESVATVTISIV